jgi:hypothetical protein
MKKLRRKFALLSVLIGALAVGVVLGRAADFIGLLSFVV